ncbi:MAG TPA: DUF3090 domain-containing protein [Acidimicrobiaceae bacterium]|nr:DUF3090 domain-containing protein [Acidimicrobiaceae bacterium]
MSVYYDFDEVDAFTVGALGEPGSRVFYLQARRSGTRVTVKCEKQQASALAEYIRRVLNDLPEPTSKPVPSAMELATPLEAAFVLGPVGLGYDRATDRVLLQLEEVMEVDDEGQPIEPDAVRGHVRVLLTRSQAAAFCDHADDVVAAGRPPCRWCTRPMNPDGHICPRMN